MKNSTFVKIALIFISLSVVSLFSCTKTVTTPAANSTSEPIFTSASGTGTLVADNSVLNYTLIPGLTAVINVSSNTSDQVLIETDGGIQLNGGDINESGFTDIAIFINGALLGSERRIPVENTNNLLYSVGAFSFTEETILAAGTYTIEVRAKKYSTLFTDCYVSSDASGSILVGNPKLQGLLNITQFP